MNVPDRIKKLTETFDYNLEMYKKGSYNETQVRREFIDPFFEELGWDIANKQVGILLINKAMQKRTKK
jgi:predicted type IV restriction endonuclease